MTPTIPPAVTACCKSTLPLWWDRSTTTLIIADATVFALFVTSSSGASRAAPHVIARVAPAQPVPGGPVAFGLPHDAHWSPPLERRSLHEGGHDPRHRYANTP